MLATQAILCVAIIGNAALFAVVLNERPSPTRTVFALYVACIAGWALSIYLNLFARSLFVEDWIFAFAAGVLTLQFWFATIFPNGSVPVKKFSGYWSLLVGCFFILASFYPGALFTSITLHPQGYTTLDTGPLSIGYSLFALVYVCAPIALLFRNYRSQHDAILRRQFRYLTIGFSSFAIIAVLTNSVLPVFFHIYTLNALGPAFSLIFAGAVFHIIGRHEFLDIRKAVQRGIIYSFLIAFIVAVYDASLIVVERYFGFARHFLAREDDVIEPILAGFITAVGIFAVPFIERYFRKKTDRFFFKDTYEYALAVESLSAILHESTDFDELIQRTQSELSGILRAEFATIILSDHAALLEVGQRYQRALASRELLFEPITVGGTEIGGILVGEKRSGDRYRAEDARLLRTFSMQASTALARAQLFMQVRKHASELEQKVAERTLQLRTAHDNERQMMLDIAHGLQIPLAVFQSKLERSRSSFPNATDFEMMNNSIAQLSDLVGNLLKLARLEYDDALRLEPVNFSRLMQEICEDTRVVARAQNIRLHSEIEQGSEINADVHELRSALLNLIGNSFKYMNKAGQREIHIQLIRQNATAALSIEDTGIGIPPEELPHIFDRFYRTKRSIEVGGSGLGLSITRAIIERHGGSIEASSIPGEGTTMVIQLPTLEVRNP